MTAHGTRKERALDDYYDTGAFTRKISTISVEAQTWFDPGARVGLRFQLRGIGTLFPTGGAGRPRLRHGLVGHRVRARPQL